MGACCGPVFWNVMFNSFLKLEFNSRIKVMAFADDLIVLTKGAYKTEEENYANLDLKKIARWAIDNKIEFDDKKFKFLFISRKRIAKRGI
jgi:hypothetical protein